MTCIVGLERGGVVYMAGDSASVGGLDIAISAHPKVFLNGPMLMGYTTSWRMGQLLQYAVQIPDHPPWLSDMKYLVVDFIDAVRECFEEKGYLRSRDGEEVRGGTFLLGYRGKLYYVSDDFQVSPYTCGYASCGCGDTIALGVLYELTTNHPKLKPETVLERALDAAVTHSAGVARPYTMLKLEAS